MSRSTEARRPAPPSLHDASASVASDGATARSRARRTAAPSLRDKLRRAAWTLVQGTAYRYSPAPLHAWRRALLRAFGAKVGPGAAPYPSATVWAPWNLEMQAGSCLGPRSVCYCVDRVVLEARSVVSQGVHLCGGTHDHRAADFALLAGPIRVGAGAWVAADAFVGPGVSIGDRAVVGARSVVVKDVPADMVVVGNPARSIARR